MTTTIQYHSVSDVASYNVLKDRCKILHEEAISIVDPSKRFERLKSIEASGLAQLVEQNPVEGCLRVSSIEFALFLLGAVEVSSTDLHNLTIGKGKEKKYYFCANNDINRNWQESHSLKMLQDLLVGLFVPGPTAYFSYLLEILSLQHRLLMYVIGKTQNPDCPDLVVFFRCLPVNFAGVLDRHAKRDDKAQHVMSSDMFTLQWQRDYGFENPTKTLATKLSDIFTTSAVNLVARSKGYGWQPSGPQTPSTRDYLEFIDSMVGGLDAYKEAIGKVYASQFGDDGKKRWWVQTPKLTPSMIATLGFLESSQSEAVASVPDALIEALVSANEMGSDALSQLFNELRKRKAAIKQIDNRYVFHALIKAWTDYKNDTVSSSYYPDKATEERIKKGKVLLARMPGIDSFAEDETENE